MQAVPDDERGNIDLNGGRHFRHNGFNLNRRQRLLQRTAPIAHAVGNAHGNQRHFGLQRFTRINTQQVQVHGVAAHLCDTGSRE